MTWFRLNEKTLRLRRTIFVPHGDHKYFDAREKEGTRAAAHSEATRDAIKVTLTRVESGPAELLRQSFPACRSEKNHRVGSPISWIVLISETKVNFGYSCLSSSLPAIWNCYLYFELVFIYLCLSSTYVVWIKGLHILMKQNNLPKEHMVHA